MTTFRVLLALAFATLCFSARVETSPGKFSTATVGNLTAQATESATAITASDKLDTIEKFGEAEEAEHDVSHESDSFQGDQHVDLLSDQAENRLQQDSSWGRRSWRPRRCSETCHQQATCTRTRKNNFGRSKWKCICKSGFTGDGKDCTPVTCNNPPPVANAVASAQSASFGKEISYYCNDGYDMSRNSIRYRCHSSGSFMSIDQGSSCVDRDECKVGVDGGDFRCASGTYDEVYQECHQNENADYCVRATFGEPADWCDGTETTCANFNIQNDAPCASCTYTNHRKGATCTNTIGGYSCGCADGGVDGGPSGYVGDGILESFGGSGCQGVRCGVVPTIEYATTTSTEAIFPNLIEYTCEDGYYSTLSGRAGGTTFDILCSQDGTFEAPDKSPCTPVTCNNPPPVANAISNYAQPVSVGDGIRYTCSQTFFVDQAAGVTTFDAVCGSDGAFSVPDQSRCTPVTCSDAPVVENAKLRESRFPISFGGHISYSCNEGYMVKGPDIGKYSQTSFQAECYGNGNFINVKACTPPFCSVSVAPYMRNALLKTPPAQFPISSGEHISYQCFSGYTIYTIYGSTTTTFELECTSDGIFISDGTTILNPADDNVDGCVLL